MAGSRLGHKQALIVKRFERLIRDALEAGFHICADSDTCSIRLITDADLRRVGVALPVHDGCGSSASVGDTGNMSIS